MINIDDVEVLISHPWINDYMPLSAWMKSGPDPSRPFVGVIAARDRMTKNRLPLRVIPLSYRNTAWSRFLIRIGWLKPPSWMVTSTKKEE